MTIIINKKITGYSVRDPKGPPPAAPQHIPAPSITVAASEPDRRLVLGRLPGIAERSLRFPKRPTDRDGFSAWTSDFILAPTGKFALCISHVVNGHTHPFEIWAMGLEQPPAASLICQLLSRVLQTDDRGFIRHHIHALKKAHEEPFALTLPHSGETITAPSVGAAIAMVYEEHAKFLGYFGDEMAEKEDSPMLAAMSSIREPKSNGQGGYATFDDVRNPSTGDDAPLFLKEAWLEGENQPMPVSLWFGSRKVPAESEAILKLASLAMRHRDPSWTAAFLKTLRKHAVIGQELGFAQVGNFKPTYYHSTWAYVADLVLHRYVQLGILDAQCNVVPQRQGALFALPEIDATPASINVQPLSHLKCPECEQVGTMVMQGGCPTCSACSYSKCG